jgi:hypothetical protein
VGFPGPHRDEQVTRVCQLLDEIIRLGVLKGGVEVDDGVVVDGFVDPNLATDLELV